MMKEAFANKVHPVTKRPLWLSQDQIASWISHRWGELKQETRDRARKSSRQRDQGDTGLDESSENEAADDD